MIVTTTVMMIVAAWVPLSGLNRTLLYVGTDITIVVAMCLIMQFALSNNFTDEAISKLLKLLHLLLPCPNQFL